MPPRSPRQCDRKGGVPPCDRLHSIATLLDRLRGVGAQDQVTALANQLLTAGMFELFREQEDHQDRFRFGREADGSPAGSWAWEDLD